MNDRETLNRLLTAVLLSLFAAVCTALPSFPADNLRLAQGLSFNSDGGNTFPLVGDHLEDAQLSSTQPTLVFFAAPGDFGCNRQARRVVDLYRRDHDKIKFVVINVDEKPASDAKALIQRYYTGYIPSEILIDKNGKIVWSADGEVARKHVEAQIGPTL